MHPRAETFEQINQRVLAEVRNAERAEGIVRTNADGRLIATRTGRFVTEPK